MNIKRNTIKIGDISFDVIHKNIKNIYLRIHPPQGRITVSAPLHMDLDSIRLFVISKMSWAKKQQNKLRCQEREEPKEFITRESHYYLGKQYLLQVIEHNATPKVLIRDDIMELCVRPNTGRKKRQEILDEWYRKKLKEIIPEIISQYEKTMKVAVNEFGIKKMRTRWGTCSINPKRIWLNLELAKKPKEYIEYVVVHEITHLLERRHNERFVTLMNKFLPKWRFFKEGLNRIPLKHENSHEKH